MNSSGRETENSSTPHSFSSRPFFRSVNGPVAGVCAGLAERFQVDALLIRLAWLFSFFIYGAGLCLYFILAVALPRSDKLDKAHEPKVLGVCSRIARKFDLDIGLTRAGFLVLLFSSLGTVALFYVILNFVLEKENIQSAGEGVKNDGN